MSDVSPDQRSKLHESLPTHRHVDKLSFSIPQRANAVDREVEDVAAPKSKKSRIMNQSFISVIASVGLSSNFNPSSGSGPGQDRTQDHTSRHGTEHVRSERKDHTRKENTLSKSDSLRRTKQSRHIPRLSSKKHRTSLTEAMMTSQILPPKGQSASPESKDGDQSSEEHAEGTSGTDSTSDVEESEDTDSGSHPEKNIQREEEEEEYDPENGVETTLAERLASMFDLPKDQEMIAEFPCCLLQDYPLHGYLYLFERYLCFYAYLPRKSSTVSKSGYLWKRGRQNPRYNRYWCQLKGDVLLYYADRNHQYFPRGTIDLRGTTLAQVGEASPKQPDSVPFSVAIATTNYHFKAESAESAKGWVEEIQKIIFRSQNTGDSLKICVPIEDILDMEHETVMEAADMMKLKVVARDETFVIDEYFFSFVECGVRAREALQNLIDRGQSIATAGNAEGTDLVDVSLDSPDQHQQRTTPESTLGLHKSNPLEGENNHSRSNLIPTESSNRGIGKCSAETSTLSPSGSLRPTDSFSSVQEFYRAGTSRLKQASNFAGYLQSQSKRVGYRLFTDSKDYYGKFHTMWSGRKAHYDTNERPLQDSSANPEVDDGNGKPGDRFRKHFSLPSSEKLRATFYGNLHRGIPVNGKFYVGSTKFCFRNLVGPRTQMILPFRDIENVVAEGRFHLRNHGLVIVVRGHEELFLDFAERVSRDDCAFTLLHTLETAQEIDDSCVLGAEDKINFDAAKLEYDLLQKARRRSFEEPIGDEPVIFDDTLASLVEFTPTKPMRITCLTIGSRGDVQPYIALCKGLIQEGHTPTIATHEEFGTWIKQHGIQFRPVAGNPAEIMQLCVENDMFTVGFLREAHTKFRGFISDLLETSWEACKDAQLLIESPSAMGGIHIAEALRIPYFRAFTMPWTKTRTYPHAFAVPNEKSGGWRNWVSYAMFDYGFWTAISGQVNRWRMQSLGLAPTTLKKLEAERVPFLYNFSPSVVPRPLDFPFHNHVTGYWFLDEGQNFEPSKDLLKFMKKARKERKKLVYIGFGSVTVDDPTALTRAISEAILDAGVRCILCKGWSDRMDKEDALVPEIPLHDSIFQIPGAPHDWLFGQVDAVAHHGGAGTTGASLRAGVPTLVKPFFGDQHFFAARIEDLGVGRCLKAINSRSLAQALQDITSNERIITRAKELGEKIRSENGVQTAIQTIYRELEYAKSLIKQQMPAEAPAEDQTEGSEESWSIVENDGGFNVSRRSTGPEFHSTLVQRRRSGFEHASAGSSEETNAEDDEDTA